MPRQRKKPAWNGQEAEQGNALAEFLRNVSGEKLRAILKRDRTFTFRLSEMDRETLDKAAKAMDIPVSEYLMRLHYIAYENLKASGEV